MGGPYGAEQALAAINRSLTMLERLEMQKSNLEHQLEEVNKVLELFKRHPEIADILEQLSKVTGFSI